MVARPPDFYFLGSNIAQVRERSTFGLRADDLVGLCTLAHRRFHFAQPSAGDHGSDDVSRRFNRRDYKLDINGVFRFAALPVRV
jgi:hypothetical protein